MLPITDFLSCTDPLDEVDSLSYHQTHHARAYITSLAAGGSKTVTGIAREVLHPEAVGRSTNSLPSTIGTKNNSTTNDWRSCKITVTGGGQRTGASSSTIQCSSEPGRRLHLLHNVTDQTIDRFSITDEKAHDSTEFDTCPWLENRPALLGLAYFKYRQFALIDENGGCFVSRLKNNANPVITEEFRKWRGRAIPLEKKQIQGVAEDLHREIIHVGIEVAFQRREYEETQSWDTKRFRVVGVCDVDADDYHLYITNLPCGELLSGDIATLYRCRWEIGVLFREL